MPPKHPINTGFGRDLKTLPSWNSLSVHDEIRTFDPNSCAFVQNGQGSNLKTNTCFGIPGQPTNQKTGSVSCSTPNRPSPRSLKTCPMGMVESFMTPKQIPKNITHNMCFMKFVGQNTTCSVILIYSHPTNICKPWTLFSQGLPVLIITNYSVFLLKSKF